MKGMRSVAATGAAAEVTPPRVPERVPVMATVPLPLRLCAVCITPSEPVMVDVDTLPALTIVAPFRTGAADPATVTDAAPEMLDDPVARAALAEMATVEAPLMDAAPRVKAAEPDTLTVPTEDAVTASVCEITWPVET